MSRAEALRWAVLMTEPSGWAVASAELARWSRGGSLDAEHPQSGAEQTPDREEQNV